ncbi:hypothetical protein Phum_PHUM464870 [Pediculus humanus corporis]|uniref:Uncharacterized protein n=1 Tax=Pediculus humanus subsp. corporis TaxID=121224 RepID=E0VVL4_PEDHC|nr:uncharacterized protein Phum_PHUM464870 [Pediculus humanus corporis]EEB17420.1 hypothetical protein Phum_PHUM464870 [Pediculus humanus corporis]
MNEEFEENKLSFLLFGSCNYLPESYTVLRSYLRVHSSNLASEYNLKLPKCFTNKNFCCPFCFTSWKANVYSFKLLPSTGKNFKTSHTSEKVTKNKLAIKCKLCKRITLFSLIKPQCSSKNDDLATISETIKKKKKKKKNCFANLNPSACKSAALQLKNTTGKESR